jgi:hypothetical protein
VLVVPPVGRVVPDAERLAPAIRVDEGDADQVPLGDGAGVGDGERVAQDRGADEGPPHVDDLDAAPEQPRGLVRGQVVRHARQRRRVRLVDVNAPDWAAEAGGGRLRGVRRLVELVGGLAADGVVEDEDLGCAGAGGGRFNWLGTKKLSLVRETWEGTNTSLSSCSVSG